MSVGGVAFAVVLVLLVLSLYRGWSAVGAVYLQLPGDAWVAQRGTADPFHSTSLLPDGRERTVARIPGVAAALPVYSRHIGLTTAGGPVDAYFMGVAVPAGLALPAAASRLVPRAGHVSLDAVLAGELGVRAGDTIDVLGRKLVVDPVRPGGNKIVDFAFVNAADARALLGEPGQVSYYLLATLPGTDPETLARAAAAAVPGSELHTSADFAASFDRLVSRGFLPVVGVLVGIGIVVGGAVIALTTYTATVERSRDYGVLKAVGADGAFLYRIVLTQSLMVGLVGSVLGILASALAATLIQRWVPEFVTDLRALDAVLVFAGALATAVAASYLPVRRINRIDPAIVFRA